MKRKLIPIIALCMALCCIAGCEGDPPESNIGTSGTSETYETVSADIVSLKGWWTREGFYYDGTNLLRISFRSTEDGYEKNTWFANGVFGSNPFWSGNVRLTDEGLEGTAETFIADEIFLSEENKGVMDIKITEEGTNAVVLTLGTGEEYHLPPLTEL